MVARIENDDVFPVAWADELERRLKGSRKLVIPGAGHACYVDAPEVFHTALLEFLRSL